MTEIEQRDLGKLVCHASLLMRRCIDNAIARATADYGAPLSGRTIWVLCYIRDHSDRDVFQKDLEEIFSVRRSTMSGILLRMEEKGFLVRTAVSYDARLKKLTLTEKGWRIHTLMEGAIDAAEEKLVRGFSAEEVETLVFLLEKLRTNLSE